jgi:pimeloyl-ACP methyl ester carboxylesterase
MSGVHVDVWGEGGQSVVLVHGAMTNGVAAWSKQRPLADRWQLVVPSRRGFVPNPPEPVSDFDVDADDIAALLAGLHEPAHVVGHSYGGLVALLAATRRPEAIRSLTLVEPAVMSLARGDALVEKAIASHVALVDASSDDPRAFLVAFTARLGGDASTVPEPLPDALRQHVELLMHERFPWEADIDVRPLVTASVATLVVSGGHDPMQETLSDAVASAIGPSATRSVIGGAGHLVQRTGEPFNATLETFLRPAA